MFNGKKIMDLIESNKLSKKEVYDAIDIAKATLDNLINNSTVPNADTLERIADFFNVTIDEFFDRSCNNINVGHIINGNGNKIHVDAHTEELKREIEHLNAIIAEKERLIQVLLKKNV